MKIEFIFIISVRSRGFSIVKIYIMYSKYERVLVSKIIYKVMNVVYNINN